MDLKTLGVIPARYASTRFPGKPLVMIAGKTMIRRVYEQVLKSSLTEVIVATDDNRIYSHVLGFGGNAMMTADTHRSGTERIGEVIHNLANGPAPRFFDIIVNIQGDEPFIDPGQIDLVVRCFDEPFVQISTLVKEIRNKEDIFNPNVVKAVVGKNGDALYFSRSPIPYHRGIPENEWHLHPVYYKHIGLYAYRRDVLDHIVNLPAGELEKAESLEQLRWLENNLPIKTMVTDFETVAIDTPEDLQKLTNNI
jgi:3-deoxy-manno-octulosonate cytidylyltransferase (CMP-KDO synthetase)